MEQYFYWGLKRNTKSLFGPPLVWSKTTLSNKIANFDVFGPKILRNGVFKYDTEAFPIFFETGPFERLPITLFLPSKLLN